MWGSRKFFVRRPAQNISSFFFAGKFIFFFCSLKTGLDELLVLMQLDALYQTKLIICWLFFFFEHLCSVACFL
jgi:hypothetical protein